MTNAKNIDRRTVRSLIDDERGKDTMDSQEMQMIISGIIRTETRKFARVSFLRGDDYAEGIIPDCIIEKSKGFTEEELCKLEAYMKDNLAELKSKSANVKPMRNWLGLNN